MSLISIFLLVIFVVCAILLLIIILLQDEQGEGLGGIFGGGGMSGQIGNRQANPLARATSILGIVFLLSCFALAWTNRSTNLENIEASARQAERESSEENWWEVPEEEVPFAESPPETEAGGESEEANFEEAVPEEVGTEEASAEEDSAP